MSAGALGLILLDRARRTDPRSAPICFFLGAGADLEAGGLTFAQLKSDVVKEFRPRSHVDALPADLIDHEFEDVLAMDIPEAQHGALLDRLFHKSLQLKPTEAHILTALLSKQRAIDAIVTTNFDDLLEKAEAIVGGGVFQTYAPGLAQPDMRGDEALFPPRPAYIKLHGDLASRVVTHLSGADIRARAYSRPITAMLSEIFRSHLIVFVGYAGRDALLADVIRAAGPLKAPVFWANIVPPDPTAPVVEALGMANVRFVQNSFSGLLRHIATVALSDMDLMAEPSVFLPQLVGSRIRDANERFLAGLPQKRAEERSAILTPRRDLERQIAEFRANENKSLAILAGPSGVGKTSLLARLCEAPSEAHIPPILVMRARSMSDTDIARKIAVELEQGSGNSMTRLYAFSAWLRSVGHDLTIAIDGINEYSPRTEETARLVRGVLEMLARIRHHRSIKILLTVRQEIWNDIVPLLDAGDLQRLLWTSRATDDSANVLTIPPFAPDEVERVFESYARRYRPDAKWADCSHEMRKALRDPFLLRMVMQESTPLGGSGVGRQMMERVLSTRLHAQMSEARASKLHALLDQLAVDRCCDGTLDGSRFSEADTDGLVDIGILRRSATGAVDFAHDRIAEHYLSRAIESLDAIPLDNVDHLLNALEAGSGNSRLRGALVNCFVAPSPRFALAARRLIFDAARLAESEHPPLSSIATSLRIFFDDVLIEMAAVNAKQFLDLYGVEAANPANPLFLRQSITRAAAYLADEDAAATWIKAIDAGPESVAAEIEPLLYDRVADCVRGNWKGSLSPLSKSPYDRWFGCKDGVERARRATGIASRLGPDNLTPRDWSTFAQSLASLTKGALVNQPMDAAALRSSAALSPLDANRFLFNAHPAWLENYYLDTARKGPFSVVLSRIEAGIAASTDDFLEIAPLASEMGHQVRFALANLLWSLSFKVDREATVRSLNEAAAAASAGTPVEQLDLLLSCLFCAHALNGVNAFAPVDRMTRDFVGRLPQMFLSNPGQERAQRQGQFLDDFDQQFEDGFNPLAFYFYHAPVAEMRGGARTRTWTSPVPLYGQLLARFERERMPKGIIRVIHALGQMASVHPEPALRELLPLVGRREPTIRRAVTRVLSECYTRMPRQTAFVIQESGATLSDAEMQAIRNADDARIRQRAFEQVHWCRMLFATEAAFGPETLPMLARSLVHSASWPESIEVFVASLANPKS